MKSYLFRVSAVLACVAHRTTATGQGIARIGGYSDWRAATVSKPVSAADKPAWFSNSGFSPEGSAEQWVYRGIRSAQHSTRLAAYSFTSREVVRRLIDAKRRGVDVAVVVDERSNIEEHRLGRAHGALNVLVAAGIPTRTLAAYRIAHDKDFVVDGETVETGSYNFSDSPARRNSENAVAIWNCPATAKVFLDHWQSRWNQGVDYPPSWRALILISED
ncbi:phospholipase D family protein [Caballeronia sp. LjRoot29]|uniref:phospholipase D family nuclease n=1 Tax=Caballeronia sp. LjRoot29 TaxID=3342315 RepID=UPI003ECFB09F